MTHAPLMAAPHEGVRPASTTARRIEVDTPTLVAVSALAWVAANLLHEVVGHAGAAVLLGIPVRAISTTTASIDWGAVESATEARIIDATATPVNLLTGALAVALLRRRPATSAPLRYFLFFFGVASFTMVALNMVTVAVLGEGDWGEVAEGLDHAALWTGAVVGVGVIVTIVAYRQLARSFLPDLGDQPGLRRTIVFVPLITMIGVQTASVVPSPFATAPAEHNHLAASVFAFIHLVVWLTLIDRGVGPRSHRPATDLTMARSVPWLTAGLVAVVLFVAVLGPGLGALEADPRLDASPLLPGERPS